MGMYGDLGPFRRVYRKSKRIHMPYPDNSNTLLNPMITIGTLHIPFVICHVCIAMPRVQT